VPLDYLQVNLPHPKNTKPMPRHGFFLCFSGCYRKQTDELFSSNYTHYQLVKNCDNFIYPLRGDNFVPLMGDNEIFKPIKEHK